MNGSNGDRRFQVNDERRYANKPLQRADFSKMDLANADFRNARLQEADFTESDLSRADFTDANLWGACFRKAKLYKAILKRANLAKCDFEGADLRDITITLNCDTFEDLKLPDKWLKCWLFFPLIMDIPEEMKKKLADIIGSETVKLLREARLAIQ
jgi:hypothetical protein